MEPLLGGSIAYNYQTRLIVNHKRVFILPPVKNRTVFESTKKGNQLNVNRLPCAVVELLGLEPRKAEPKSAVLPITP